MKNTALTAIMGIMILLAGCTNSQQMSGATIATQSFIIPVGPDDSYTAPYLMIWDIADGDLALAATGVLAATNAWGDCDIAGTICSTGTGTNTAAWKFTIPALDSAYRYGMGVFDNASPADTDTMETGPWIYDPTTNTTYSDTNPLNGYRVIVKPEP